MHIYFVGMDETGKDIMCLQTAGLENAFDVRCFVIPLDDLTSWDKLTEKVVALTQAELDKLLPSVPEAQRLAKIFPHV